VPECCIKYLKLKVIGTGKTTMHVFALHKCGSSVEEPALKNIVFKQGESRDSSQPIWLNA
jgi:hypothetical protein